MEKSCILMAGGGIRCFAYVGALHYLHKQSILPLIRHFVGVSGGAFMAILCCLGYTPYEGYITLRTRGMLTSIFDSFFLESVEEVWVEKALTLLLENKGFHANITFEDLYSLTKKHVCIVTSDMRREVPIYMNHTTTPKVSIVEAVKASAAIPFVFEPILIDNYHCVDGALTDPFPLKWVESYWKIPPKNVITMLVSDSSTTHDEASYTLASKVLRLCWKRIIKTSALSDTMIFAFDNIYPVHFNIPVEEIDNIVHFGYDISVDWLGKCVRERTRSA